MTQPPKKAAKARSRVSYSTESGLRAKAKESGEGLVTVSVLHPNGRLHEVQFVAGMAARRFAEWMGSLAGRPDLVSIEELEAFCTQVSGEPAPKEEA